MIMTVILAFIIAMIVLFLHATTWKGMIFEGIKKIIPAEGMIYKPIYGCPICMTPWWGSIIYMVFLMATGTPFWWLHWLLTIGCASGISVLSVVFVDLKDAAIAYKKEVE